MSRKLSVTEKIIYDRVDEILFYLWDPIGVNDAPQARDEYRSYLGPVFSKLIHNSTKSDIVDYLVMIESENMDLSPDKKHATNIVNILFEMKEMVDETTS